MRSPRRLLPLAAVLTLAACAAPELPALSSVTATTDRGLAARGTSSFTVSTRAPGVFGPAEVAGIPCTLEAPGFRAAFTTPATVAVPNLGARQPEAMLTCTRGNATQSLTLAPVNLTRAAETNRRLQAQSGSRDLPGLSLIATAMVAGLRADRTGDVWGYADTTLRFER